MRTVLVVDDQMPIRLLVRMNLEPVGIRVLEAADGPAALEIARRERPDVVLLDVMLPGLDGWGVAEQLFSDPATHDLPVVFMSARADFADQAKGIEIGGLDYLTKPFDPVALEPMLRELLAKARRGASAELRSGASAELRCEKLALLRQRFEPGGDAVRLH